MSRFWMGGGSSSDEESEEEVKSEASEEETPVATTQTKGGSKFMKSEDSDDEDDNKKRVVKSTRDRRFDDIKDTISKIKNHMKINDWNAIHNEFEKLNKQIQKANQIIQKEGVPRFYTKTLVMLEDFVKKTQENKTKVTMNATNSKSFNTMKQKLKKHNKTYEKEIEQYRKNPDAEDEDAEDKAEEEDESEEEKPKKAASGPSKWFTKPGKDQNEESESEEEEEEEESEESESSGGEYQEKEDRSKKWFVSGTTKKDDKKSKDKKPIKKPEEVSTPAPTTSATPAAVTPAAPAPVVPEKPKEMNAEEIRNKLKEVLQQRGKRGTDPTKQAEKFTELLNYAKDPELQVEILIQIISNQFDASRTVATHMPIPLWKATFQNFSKLLSLLEANPSIKIHESEDLTAAVPASSSDSVDDNSADGEVEEAKQVAGNLVAFIERLDDELTKSFQAIDPHTQDYVQRLQDENTLLELAERTQIYYQRIDKVKHAARVAERRVEHFYYKLETVANQQLSQTTDDNSSNQRSVLEKLATLIYAHGDERLKTRTMLCHIYYHALHDRFYEARDMMLMSHLQDGINQMDIPTQILFNRTMAQLGLCAFRNNMIKQAHSCLSELYSSGRVKELLAQGISMTRYNDKSAEQERQERKRQLPYHMHINLELLEAVHLICAMLLEIPNMAAHAYDVKKKIISRTFHRLLEYYDRQVFTGPPENNKDAIMTASKHLSRGDWKKSEQLLLGLNVWSLVPNSDQVKAMLRRRIQEEGLRTYLFTYSNLYSSMSLELLSEMFELPKNTVHAIVSKMMISEELHASWDQPTSAIVLHNIEPTRLQYLAMQLAEKAAGFVEVNERNLNMDQGYPQRRDRDRDQTEGGATGGDNREKRDNKSGSSGQRGERRQDRSWQQGGDQRRRGQTTNKKGGSSQQRQQGKGQQWFGKM